MDRAAVLQQVFESAGIRNCGRWVQKEVLEGERGAGLESGALFCAIATQLFRDRDAGWFDAYASSTSTRPSHTRLDESVKRIAASDCDRQALAEVVRYFQTQIAYVFFALHDGMTSASKELESVEFRLVYATAGDREANVDEDECRFRYLPDDLYDKFGTFLQDFQDEEVIFDDPV